MILIVEDNRENAELVKLYLERKAGLESRVCVEGEEVMRLCCSGEVQLVIMDVQLKRTYLKGRPMGGVELTRELKADSRTCTIPVLLATAHAMREDREQFLRTSGADGYLTKPVEDLAALLDEVNRLRTRVPVTRERVPPPR